MKSPNLKHFLPFIPLNQEIAGQIIKKNDKVHSIILFTPFETNL